MSNPYYKLKNLKEILKDGKEVDFSNFIINDENSYYTIMQKTYALIYNLSTYTDYSSIQITEELDLWKLNALRINTTPTSIEINTTTDYNETVKFEITSPVPLYTEYTKTSLHGSSSSDENSLMNIANTVGTSRAYVGSGTTILKEQTENQYIYEIGIPIKVEAGYKYKTTGRPIPKPKIYILIVPKQLPIYSENLYQTISVNLITE